MTEEWRKFRKKPIIIEAYRTNRQKVIHTLEGDFLARKGDWIIRGVKGELYPCKPDIFEQTYEPAEFSTTEGDPTWVLKKKQILAQASLERKDR